VLAINEDTELAALPDPAVLSLAAREGRMLITFNHRDFAPLVRDWAEARHDHAGCVIVYGIDHSEFGLLLMRLRTLLESRPIQNEWPSLTLPLTRGIDL
jgi:hypothetical protein